jgi:hypothetical protein
VNSQSSKLAPCTPDFQFTFRSFPNKLGLVTWPLSVKNMAHPSCLLSSFQSLSASLFLPQIALCAPSYVVPSSLSLQSTVAMTQGALDPISCLAPMSRAVVCMSSRAEEAAKVPPPPSRMARALLSIPRGGRASSRAVEASVGSSPARTMGGKEVPSPSQPRHCLQSGGIAPIPMSSDNISKSLPEFCMIKCID